MSDNNRSGNNDEERWHCEFSEEEINKLEPEKLEFALAESRTYLDDISKKTDRLSNKAFILMGVIGGIMAFVVSRSFVVLLDRTNTVAYILQHYWSVALLVLFCLGCWLDALYTLIASVLHPIGYRPLGTFPENLLRKGIFEKVNPNRLIVRQLECYQKVADDNIEENGRMASCVRRCLQWAFVYPMAATFIWFLLNLLTIALRQAAGWV